jgi:hypothetical protein
LVEYEERSRRFGQRIRRERRLAGMSGFVCASDGRRARMNAPKGQSATNLGVAIMAQDVRIREILESRTSEVGAG